MSPRYSIVVPVYNRPDELQELLGSLTQQTYRDFEVLIVEDGSTRTAERVVDQYRDQLPLHYFYKPNSGPGPSRNFGFAHAQGQYLLMFDSDCLLPPDYLAIVDASVRENNWDAWGGPDRAHGRFTVLQRAMAYTMSSVLTTGGIRGGSVRLGAFQLRSFNMGMSHNAYQQSGGFRFSRFAEDIELSIRLRKMGLKIGLIADAFVYHKRRETLSAFFRQVSNFGRGRVQVGRAHRGAVKFTHWFPALFLIGLLLLLPMALLNVALFKVGAILFCVYLLAIGVHAYVQSRSIPVALLAIPSALVQLCGYGSGFLKEWFARSSVPTNRWR